MKHIFFSGIGGTGIGPLALIAHQAGYNVSGSDKQASQYTKYLQSRGIKLHIGQTKEALATVHQSQPIDWYVYSSALPLENPQHPELLEAQELSIHTSKRDEFLAYFLADKGLRLLAFAGTHGKTSSTAMAVWAANQLGVDVSYSVGAKLSFGDMGHFSPQSEYFLYECDEFDRNFLAYSPNISVLTKVDWDHHEQYITRNDYIAAFRQFCQQSATIIAHPEEIAYLSLDKTDTAVLEIPSELNDAITLKGAHNRRNAAGVAMAIGRITNRPQSEVIAALNSFPGSSRRFEQLAPNVYSDYAHTPEEIAATLQLAREYNQPIMVVYEPLTNRRQHYMQQQYKDIFKDIQKLYWLPSYLAREDPDQHVITPDELIAQLDSDIPAEAAVKNDVLMFNIKEAASKGWLVLLLAGGGGNSLDEWARHWLSQ